MEDIPIIDAHVALGQEHHLRLDSRELVAKLEDAHVSMAIARPMGAELAVFNRRGNDRVLSAGKATRALVTVNPWFGSEAIQELERCIGAGAVGLYLHPSRQGFMPTDPIARPIVEFCEGAGWPIVFQTGTYIHSDVLAVAEMAGRYPGVTFLCESAGFSDMWFELPEILARRPNLHFIASLIWPRAISNTVRDHGPERILFGSGEPRDSLTAALQRIERLELTEGVRRAILHDNAARVFRLEASAP